MIVRHEFYRMNSSEHESHVWHLAFDTDDLKLYVEHKRQHHNGVDWEIDAGGMKLETFLSHNGIAQDKLKEYIGRMMQLGDQD